MNKPVKAVSANPSWTYPVKTNREAFREALAYLYLHQLRILAWFVGEEDEWSVLGRTAKDLRYSLFDPSCPVHERPSYAEMESTRFAQAMQSIYDLAYFGILDESWVEPMEDETLYMWNALIVKDMKRSAVSDEWVGFDGYLSTAAAEVWKVIELAQARLNLEGLKGFLDVEDEFEDTQCLTVRQLALLADVEEMSIRSAASRKGPNAPPVDPNAEGTRFHHTAAKEWLIAKGRYVSITRRYSKSLIDLAKHGFPSVLELLRYLNLREDHLRNTSSAVERGFVMTTLAKHNVPTVGEGVTAETLAHHLLQPALLSEVARGLDLPEELFALRAREVVAKEEAAEVKRKLALLTSGGEKR